MAEIWCYELDGQEIWGDRVFLVTLCYAVWCGRRICGVVVVV